MELVSLAPAPAAPPPAAPPPAAESAASLALSASSPLRVRPDDGPLHLGAPKVIIVGTPGVGKTSILRRARTGRFEEREPTSIGCACVGLSVDLPNGCTKALQAWDTAGQERFNALSRQYMRGCADLQSFLAWPPI